MISESASSARRLAALSAMPGCGRSSARSAANAASVPSWPSTLIAAVMSAVRSSSRRSWQASTSMPSMPSVPLISARPSFSASTTGSMPAAASASAADASAPSAVRTCALAGHRERAVRERRQVTRAAQRPVLAHHRGDAGGDQARVGPRRLRAHPGPAGGQRGQPQQHHRPHHLPLHLGPGPGRVRADQAALQQHPALARDVPGGQRAEPGGDPVLRLRSVGQRLDHGPARRDAPLRLVGQAHRSRAAGHRDDLLPAERPDTDDDGGIDENMIGDLVLGHRAI